MKTETRHRSWIVIVPLVAAAALYLTLFLLPRERAIRELREQVTAKQQYVIRSAGLPTTLQAARQELDQTRAYVAARRTDCPHPTDLSAAYGRIHQLAKAAGTTTTRFDPEPIIPYDEVCEAPLTIGCTGSFAQVFEFLRSLEGLPLRIWMNSLEVEKVSGSDEYVTTELSLVVFADKIENSDYAGYSQ